MAFTRRSTRRAAARRGRFYVWRKDEIAGVLGEEEGAFFAGVYGVEEHGNFADEATGRPMAANVLYLPQPLEHVAERAGIPPAELAARLDRDREALLAARNSRTRPRADDKVLASWNGLTISALARAGAAFGEPRYVEAARSAAGFILTRMRRADGRLFHAWREGDAHVDGFLEDYAYLANGLLDLHEATREKAYLDEAAALCDAIVALFADEAGGLFATARDAQVVLARARDVYDKAMPSGTGMAAQAFVRVGRAAGESRYIDQAAKTLAPLTGFMLASGRAASSLILALAMYLDAASASG